MSEVDAHAPLRQDVRLLGRLLGNTLQEQESPVLLEKRAFAVARLIQSELGG